MGHYIKHKKNYWDRKIFDREKNFDIEILKHKNLKTDQAQKLFKKYVELICLEMSYYCNRACSYCPVAIFERSDKNLEIDNELLQSIIISLKKIDYDGRISLNLFNEPLASKNFVDRVKVLKTLRSDIIKPVPTDFCETQEELDACYSAYTEDGYEGQMVRNNTPYECKRSKNLLKRKEFITEEFKVVQVIEGQGAWTGYAKRFILALPDGTEFGSGVRGTQAQLKELLENSEKPN